mgnify:CR=1 FL=1|tara:strand:+ start:1088 stop:1489 length:402 start_codon:yes stop_codon:yes gene_type:complete
MIVINKNATTNFVATLYELSQLTNPNYLFEFESDQTKVKYYTIISDISTNKPRYNEFNFIEGSNDPTNGTLILGSAGFYNYKVYEQVSSSNLDPTGLNKVEEGKLKLIDSTYQPSFTQHSVSPTTNVVYNPAQ